jgi:hypothetical protein|tara:strand:+ start:874 stop:1374 length:501 start_codon:yes stop_codon:yes gene_type:complete
MVLVQTPPGVKLDEVVAGTGTSSDEGAQFPVGQVAELDKNGEAMYVHASAAIAVGDFVGIDEAYESAPITKAMADDGWMVGVCVDVAIADNEFGWVRMRGTGFSGMLLTSCAADVPLYTSATAGALDDASSSQTQIRGVVTTTAVGGGGAAVSPLIVTTRMRSTTF